MKRIVNGIAIGLLTLLAMAASLFISRLIWLQIYGVIPWTYVYD